MPQDILFNIDSTSLRPGLRRDLAVLANNLNDYPDTTVDILGHTDNTGTAEHNQNLSARRASAVAAVLRDAGVAPSRLRAFGRGEDEPVSSNLTAEGRRANRRVEIVIRPVQ
jgi:outer membrane protein OmpA-like peptidoglycan-associated protein